MAISQGSNLINVAVHNSADSRNASLSAIILSHVLAVAPEPPNLLPPCVQVLQSEAGYMQRGRKESLHRLLISHLVNGLEIVISM